MTNLRFVLTFPGYSIRRICKVLQTARSAVGKRKQTARRERPVDERLVSRIRNLVKKYPTVGYRMLWAMLRKEGVKVNRNKVYRILKRYGLFVHQRVRTPRPRVKGRRSIAAESNVRWATDLTHIFCGHDGWAHLVGVIDCHDRELIGYEFSLRGRAREAEGALEEACIARFGTLRPEGARPVVRSDNGLIFQIRRVRAACRDYGLSQEFVTPYTPEQNGLIERFFRTLKEECVRQHRFRSFAQARREIERWIEWYNSDRPHQELGYLSPREYRGKKVQEVA